MNRIRTIALAGLALLTLTLMSGKAQAQVAGSKAVPSSVQRIWLANERIYVEVFVDNLESPSNNPDGSVAASTYPYGEHYGNRLGDIIPMRIRVFTILGAGKASTGAAALGSKLLPKTELRFENLMAGSLTIDKDPENDPDWVFAKKESLHGRSPLELPTSPKVVVIETPDGEKREAELWDIRCFVQTKRRPEPMLFWLEFSYATEINANGTHDWKRAETPDFIVSGSYTGDKGRDLETGNTNVIVPEQPRVLSLGLVWFGSILAFLVLGVTAVRAIQRRILSVNGKTDKLTPSDVWAKIDPILEAKTVPTGYALDVRDVATIVTVFKQYIGFSGGVAQFRKSKGNYDDAEDILRILETLETSVLEQEQKDITPERFKVTIDRIATLCPRV